MSLTCAFNDDTLTYQTSEVQDFGHPGSSEPVGAEIGTHSHATSNLVEKKSQDDS